MADKSYLQWVREQPCACQPCGARSEAHHPTNGETERHAKSLGGRRGLSQKAADATAFPLCPKHHDQLHDGRGFFEDMNRSARRAWQDEQSALWRFRYEQFTLPPSGKPIDLSTPPTKVRATLRQEAEAFGSTYALGPQVIHDLERLLKHVVKEHR